MILSEEEKKKREEEAKSIINMNSIGDTINSINYANLNKQQIKTNNENEELFVKKVNEANDIINSINPRQNVETSSISEEDKVKLEKNGQKFLDLIDGNKTINTDSDKDIDIQEDVIQNEKTDNTLLNKSLYVGKKTGAGLLSGITGIAQAATTDAANNMEKGKDKSFMDLIHSFINNITGNTAGNIIKDSINYNKEAINILKDENTNPLQKLVALSLNAVSQGNNILPIKQQLNNTSQLIGKINPNASETIMNLNNTISEPIKNINNSLNEEGQDYDGITQTLGNVGQVIGNMIPSITAYGITKNPTVSLATMGISAKGQSTQEALEKGAELDEAVKIGDTKGMIEIGTELLTGGLNIFGKGALDDIVKRGIVDKVQNEVKKKIVQMGLDVAGETLEETISDVLDTKIDKGTVNPEANYSLKDWGNTVITTVLSTVVLNALTGGIAGNIYGNQNEDIQNEDNSINKDNMGTFYTIDRSQDGQVEQINAVQGKEINNPNKQLNINPVIIMNEDANAYNVIDGNTGIVLDNTYYDTILGATAGFNKLAINLSEAQIQDVNNKVDEANYMIADKLMSTMSEIDNQIQNENTTENVENKNSDNLNNEPTNYSAENVKSITNLFKSQKEYTKNEMANIWNNEVDAKDLNVVSDNNGNTQSYIAIEEDGNDLVVSQYDNNNNVVKSETITTQNGKYNAEAIKNTIEKVTGVYKENNANKTPQKSNFYDNKVKYQVSNINEIEKGLGKNKTYTLEEISDKWDNIMEDTYDLTLQDDNYVYLDENNGKLEATLYDGETSKVIDSVEIKPNKDGKYSSTDINNAVKKVATIIDENKPIKGQVDIEGNEVRSMKKNKKQERGNDNDKANNPQQKTSRAKERKNTRGEKEISRSNESNQEKLSRSIQQFQKEQQKQLGKDFKISLAEENKLTNTERIIQNEFENITGLNYGIYETNKGTSEDAVYIDDSILVKHNSLQNKKKSNFLPFHELGHWFKENKSTEWNAVHDIIDNTITKNQIEEYKNVLKDTSMFDDMSETEIREYIIEEIESDYFGNWANDISNWVDMINNKTLSNEYVQLLMDISDENYSTHYNIFGTEEQQEQVYKEISEIMNNFNAKKQSSNNKISNNDLSKAIQNIQNSKDTIDRKDIITIINNVDFYIKKGSKKISDRKMEQRSGHNINPSITKLNNIYPNTTKKTLKLFLNNAFSKSMSLFKDTNVTIKDTNTKALIKKSGLDENYNKNYDAKTDKVKVNTADTLNKIIEEGIYGYTTINENDPNKILYHNYFSVVEYNNKNELIRTIIKEYPKQSHIQDSFYYQKVESLDNYLKQNEDLVPPYIANNSESKDFEHKSSLKNSIPQKNQKVKKSNNKSLKKSNRIDIITTDSKGRTLTKEQQDFYEGNDVIDKNGNLQVVYHGTPFGEFTKFNDKNLYFFSVDRNFAEDYAYQKSFEQALDGNVKVMEVYLKAKNVFDPSKKEDIQKLREALPDKIRFWATTFDKETFLQRLQRIDDLPSMWTKEQIKNAKFGHVIGDDRYGYNNDIFIGVNKNNEVVYAQHAYGQILEHLTSKEREQAKKKLLNGEQYVETLYTTPFGQLTENGIRERISQLREQDKHYLTDILKYLEEGKYYMVDSSTYTVSPYTASQESEHLTDIDNWEYIEGSNAWENNEVGKDVIDIIKDLGYDGLKVYEKGKLNYAVFNKNQIKNVDNKKPTSNPDLRYSNRYDTEENGEGGFYSQLEQVIEQKMPNTSNAQQIRGIIENSGIKQDELKWIGLDDYLKQHSLEKISKEQLQEYIKSNQINLVTVKKGDRNVETLTAPIKEDIKYKIQAIKKLHDKYHIDYEESDDDIYYYKPNGLSAGTIGDYMADTLKRFVNLDDSELFEKQEDGSYLSSYTTDGVSWQSGITEEILENDMQELSNLYDELHEAQMNLSMIEDEYSDDADEIGKPKYKQYSLEGGTNYQEILYTIPAIEKLDNSKYEVKNLAVANVSEYESPHWHEKNVLAHVRTQDFKDSSGKKVLFIDEIQSDLHQEGRKKGYSTQKDIDTIDKLNEQLNNLKATYSVYEDEARKLSNKGFSAARDYYTEHHNKAIDNISHLEEKFKINEKLTQKQQYELLDYENAIADYLSKLNRENNNFRENIESEPYMMTKIREAEKELNLSLSKEILEKQSQSTVYRKRALENFKVEYYDYGNLSNLVWGKWTRKYLSSEDQQRYTFLDNETDKLADQRVALQKEIDKYKRGIPDIFPFKKNWHEFVLRRMINNAVEQGYDEVAWTTGRQQRERYNLTKVIDSIEYYKPDNFEVEGTAVSITAYKDGKNVYTEAIEKDKLADYIGKNLASKIINSKEKEGTISNLDETINENPNSGMYLFYDQEIPSYLNKYLKKWNSKVEEITLKDADGKSESKQMGFKITDEMRNSIKQNGQPLFSNRQLEDSENSSYDEKVQQRNRELIKELRGETIDENIHFTKRTAKNQNNNNNNTQRNAERQGSYIEEEIQKIEKTGNWDNSIPVTKLTDIRKTIEDYLGLGIKKGHFRQSAYAIYKGNRDVIRTKEFKDMDSILHETGHALDIGNRLKVDKESIANELLTAIDKLGGYEDETRAIRLEEGFAEVIREYSIVPNQAKLEYPQTVSVLEGLRKTDKSFNNFITKVQEQTYNYIHQNPRNRTLSNVSIGEQTDRTPLTKNWIKQEFMRNVYDKDYALKSGVNTMQKINGKTVNQLKASENAYYLTRLTSGITDKVTSMLADGYIDTKGNKLMPGLNQIGEILGNDPQRFDDLRAYLVAKRDVDYRAKTLKTGIRSMDSKAVIEQFKNDTQIQEAAKLVYDTLDGVMQYAVNNRLVTQEVADKLKESNAFYVPMQRVLENKGNQVGRRGAVADIIKQRTGSELDIKDVLENIIANSSNVIQQVENNNVLKALYKQGEAVGVTGKVYDVIDAPMVKVGTAKLSTWEGELKKQGVNTVDLDLEKTIDLFAPNNKVDAQNLITSFINDNGKRVYLQFNDELLFNSVMNMDKKFMSNVLKINAKLNMPLRYGATMANIGFAIPNMISDTAQAAIFSNAGFIPVVDNALGVLDILAATNKKVRDFVNQVSPGYADKINNLYTIYKQTGATSSTRLSQYRESTQNLMKDVYGVNKSENMGIHEKFKPLKRLLDLMTYIPEISEQSTRFEVFKKNYEQYKNKGNAEIDARIMAALESRDATQDFGRTGNITREINQLIPFSAARVGSAYTFAEKVTANPKQVGMRIAVLTALAMAIKGMGYDDDEVQELIQRKKDDNFVLKIGDSVVTIKKPQGILRSIVNLTEYIQDLTTGHIEEGKEGEKLGEWLNNAIMDNMPADQITGLVPNMVAPLIENAINKDFYYNTDIVKSYDLELPDYEQYYDYNSQLAILLGKVFNYSPAKIDNIISGYFAGLGTQITNIMDFGLGKIGATAEKPEMGAETDAVGKRFIVNVNSNSSSVDEIYSRKTELTKLKNGGTISEEEQQELETLTVAIKNMSNLNKQIKAIKKDLTMSGKEKAEQIKLLQQEKTDTARQALGKNVIFSENEDKIQSTQFYPSQDTLKKNGYTLTLNSEMKKEYEQLASEYYSKYEKQGLYSKEKLEDIKSKAKTYAKNEMLKKYKSDLVNNKKN